MEKKKALGRGMSSLIPDPSLLEDSATPPKTYFYCDVENIIPNKEQPRKRFNEEKIVELSNSIKEKGILQPILVRREGEFQYEIISGERRWRAAQKAGLMQVPVIIRESSVSGKIEDALIENLQREDLNPMEEAAAYQKLIDEHEYTQDVIAQKIGKNRSTVANSLRLLSLSEFVRTLVLEEKLSAGHARTLLSLEDKIKQEELAKIIMAKKLSVRQTEALVKKTGKEIKPLSKNEDLFFEVLGQELSQHFKAKVKIKNQGKKGKIEIEYFGEDELNRIISLLKA